MGRKSRMKRERAEVEAARDAARPPSPPKAPAPVADFEAAPEPVVENRRKRQRKSRAVGARVARVAVDDATWLAFRELCGSMPASIRLGQLVMAEVQRVRNPPPEPDAVAAVAAIRAHVDELEAFVRDAAPQR
jgi:hypothetical protein